MNQRGFAVITVVLTAAIALAISSAIVLFTLKDPETKQSQIQNPPATNQIDANLKTAVDTSSWQTYENVKYGFALSYPEDWRVYEGLSPQLDPVISFYDGSSYAPNHHYDPSTAVVILPEGSLQEGMLCGQSREGQLNLTEPNLKVIDCLLSDGTPWASKASYDVWTKSGWKGGFIWANTRIENLNASQNGTELIRSGKISAKDRKIEEKIIESFRFNSQKAKTSAWGPYVNPEDGYEIEYPLEYPQTFGPVAIGGNLVNEVLGPDLGTILIVSGSFTDFSSATIEMSSNAGLACKNLALSVKPIDPKVIGGRTFNKQSLDSDGDINTIYSIEHADTCYIFNLRTAGVKGYGRDFYELTQVIERMLETLKFMY